MDIYEAYYNSAKDKLVFVKFGNNFRAGIFAPFWAIYNRMWIVGSILFAVLLLLEFCEDVIFIKNYGFIVSIFIFLLFYLLGNSILAYKLKNSGYVLERIVFARSIEEAEYLLLKKRGEE